MHGRLPGTLFALFALLTFTAGFTAFSGPSLADTTPSLYQGQPAKYIFLFIGDGLGIPQRTAAEQFTGDKLVIDTFPAQGITTTHANDRFITGSAASATAMASGVKTNINYIGVDPHYKPVKTLAEMAKEKDRKVGIISSVSIDHATPAAFYAHVKHRSMYHEVDHALVNSGFDFFGGGGLKDPAGERKKKKDPQAETLGDALEVAAQNGYKVLTDKAEFMKLTAEDGKVIAYNAWLQDSGALPYAMDRRQEDISLAEFTAKAIEMLDNSEGFFIMVEGGKIDWACHANDGTAAIHDTVAFDNAVRQAVDFYKAHPDETLIVVSGDHECGGLTLGFAGTKYDSHFAFLGNQKVSFQKFTDEVLKAYKDTCGGEFSFEDAKPLITENFGLKFDGDPKADPMVLEPFQVKMLQEAFNRSMGGEEEASKNPETYLLYGGYDPLTISLTHILNNKAGLGWTSFKHTGVPVSTSAMGVGAAIFNGYYDNTDIAKKIMSVMGVPAQVQYAAH